ncbi:tail completion protein gp17 [Novosphingobium sp. NPDC080210]|uniref:tail completion protein gp17 n=1 Tax=Novosphingobium sp. NPDC080210 TaxID=3390596 RepID=UPI003D0616EB
MNGVIVVRSLLVADTGLTALVTEARIAAGSLPQGTELPAISLISVSSVDRNIPAPGSKRRVTERVQVTVLARTYPETKSILAAIRRAAADQMPAIDGLTDVTVHTDSAGPDFLDEETGIHMQSQDFRVAFNEAR